MRRFLIAALLGLLICQPSFADSTSVKGQIGLQDLNLDADNSSHGTFQRRTSTGGQITLDKIDGNQIPWSNAYTRTIRPLSITGNGTGSITGFPSITGNGTGSITGFPSITGDNTGSITGFPSITGDGTGSITGFPSITGDGTGSITGFNIPLSDNSVAPAKLQNNGGVASSGTYYRGDGAWSTPAPDALGDNTVTPAKLYSTSGTPDNTTFYRGDGAWASHPYVSMPFTYKNLVVKSVVDNQNVDIDADYVIVADNTLSMYLAASVNLTVDLATSGAANGLDNGSLAANTGYFLYVIYNGSTVAGLASTSATAPVMPSGYTYKALVGWCTTDATTTPFNVLEFEQTDDLYAWLPGIKIVASSGVVGAGTSLDLSGGGVKTYDVIPPGIVKSVLGRVYILGAGGNVFLHPVTFSDGPTEAFATEGGAGAANFGSYEVPVHENQTLYYQASNNSDVWLSGFKLKR